MSSFSKGWFRLFVVLVVCLAWTEQGRTQSPVAVTLTPTASPTAAEPGVTSVSLTGSNFPAGTITPASVIVTLTPSAGTAVTTPATAITTVTGTTRRVTFTVPASVSVASPTAYSATLAGSTSTGTLFSSSNAASLTVNPLAKLLTLTPNTGEAGQTIPVTITGQYSNFVQGATQASFGAGITVNSLNVTSPTQATANITITAVAASGTRTVTVTTGSETASLPSGFSVPAAPSAPATLTDFNPKSASVGAVITVSGTNLLPAAGTSAQFSLSKQGGGTVTGFASSVTATSLTFAIPAGAATGPPSITVNGLTVTAATSLTIVPSSIFSISATPNSAKLLQGQSVGYSVALSTTNGFKMLAALSVSGLPSGVKASFNPPNITAGEMSVLTLTAPQTQAVATTPITVTASATIDGMPISQSQNVGVSVVAPTTSFLGRTVVSDAVETSLGGVTVTMLGKDGNGNNTGCSGNTVSDSGGNFLLTNLPSSCVGPQLIGFDGTTVTNPAGKYAGVNLVFTFVAGQVTASPVLVHLPRIDTVETFMVTQNSATNQSYAFTSIPGLSVTVYAGTIFTLQDGTKPNPFPLAAVQVPVDRLPDLKPNVPTMIRAFIVAFQPANASTNQPVAVLFPNSLNTAPGTNMILMTLDPTHGQMVPYGTGTVSADATQIIPSADPAYPGHQYGLIHFDWHGPMPPPPPQNNPAPPSSGGGDGGNPGGGSGPGNGNGGNNGGDDDGGGDGDDSGGAGDDSDGNSCSATLVMPQKVDSERTVLAATNTRRSSDVNENKPASDEGRAEAGDPVDMASGIQRLTHRDLMIRGSRGSIVFERNYRSLTTLGGPFGIGGNHNFNYGLDTAFPTLASTINLIMPDGNRFAFAHRLCPNVVIKGVPFVCSSALTNGNIPALAGATLTVNPDSTTDLRWKTGIVYHFAPISLQAGSLLSSITDPNGNTIAIARDGAGNVTTITDPVGRTLTFAYDGSNRIVSITDSTGRKTQYTYNSQGSLATFTNPMGSVTQFSYDSNNNLLQLTDPRGIVQIQNVLDSNGRVVKQTRPDGGSLTFTYTAVNPLASVSPLLASEVIDLKGVKASYRFNTDGYVTDVTSTQGQTKHIILEAGTNLRSGVVVATSKTNSTYDPNGNVLSHTDATGLTTTFTYEYTFNKLTRITDPLGNVTTFAYDSKGNLTKTTDANGNSTFYQYDSTGLVTKVTDALNQSKTYSYDGTGNQISVTDPFGNSTQYSYDGLSRLTQTIDTLGRRTNFAYDGLGRLLTRTNAKGGITTSTYDADGNLTLLKDAMGNANTFAYDSMNRLASRTDGLGKSDARTWDTNGNLTKYVDRRGQTSTYAYDALNRLTTETYLDATVTRSYDSFGLLSRVDDSTSGTFSFTYDLVGRLILSSTPVGDVVYNYDGRGQMASRQVAGQQTLSYGYDPAGNLISAALPQVSAGFTYDSRNQLSKITRANGVTSAFVFDSNAQLLSITHAAGAAMIDTESYSYDAVGNRKSHSTSVGQSSTTQSTTNQFNAANQLTSFSGIANTYDGNGNLAQQGSDSYTWDSRGRLKSVTTAAGQATAFRYDFAGNLIQQSDNGPSLNLTKIFVVDNMSNVAYESGSDGSAYSVLAGRSIDSHMAISQSTGQVQYGLADAVNSTVTTVDQTGAVKSQFFYDAYGQSPTIGNYPFQFTGRVPVSSNLYYYRARFYNTQTGRFISEDPIGLAGGSNFYRYVENNPTGATDPSGLRAPCLAWSSLGGVPYCRTYGYDTDDDIYRLGPTPILDRQPTPLSPPLPPVASVAPPPVATVAPPLQSPTTSSGARPYGPSKYEFQFEQDKRSRLESLGLGPLEDFIMPSPFEIFGPIGTGIERALKLLEIWRAGQETGCLNR